MIRGATSKLAAALGLPGSKAASDHNSAGESARCVATETAKPRNETVAGRVESLARAKPRRRALPSRVREHDAAMYREFVVWLQQNEIAGEIRACDLFRCHVEFAQTTGAPSLTPRQLSIALGMLGLKKRRLRVRDRSSGRVCKLASGVPIRATRYLIPDHSITAAAPVESACVIAIEQSNRNGVRAKIGRVA